MERQVLPYVESECIVPQVPATSSGTRSLGWRRRQRRAVQTIIRFAMEWLAKLSLSYKRLASCLIAMRGGRSLKTDQIISLANCRQSAPSVPGLAEFRYQD